MNWINPAHQKINKSSRLDRRLSSPKRPFARAIIAFKLQ